MFFWWYIFICDLIVPMIMFLGGIIMSKHYPGRINGLMGYRTERSMKNADTWKFAHEYCGRLWKGVGATAFILTALLHIPLYGCNDGTLGIASIIFVFAHIVTLLVPVILTERALKNTFNEDGSRR